MIRSLSARIGKTEENVNTRLYTKQEPKSSKTAVQKKMKQEKTENTTQI